MRRLRRVGCFQWRDEVIEASLHQRVKIAIQALRLGADLERTCKFLRWNEFENIAAEAFVVNNYTVTKHFRFKWAGRRREIDVLACKEPLIACVDCKQWRRGWLRSSIKRVVEAQVERTKALREAFPSLYQEVGLANWKEATLIPLVLSLVAGPFKFYNKVPVVPILQLQNFINELPARANSLMRFFASF